MNKTIDLTDFRVTESDNGESYVVLEKNFDAIHKAVQFQSVIESAIEEQAKAGVFTECQLFGHPFAYRPLIQVKAEDFWNAYDEEGDLLDGEPDIIEQLVAVFESDIFANQYGREPTDPGTLRIKISLGITPKEWEMQEKKEIKITCV